MFERFTEEARAVVVGAQLHARRLGHGYLGCEHLLLALSSTNGQIGLTLRGLGLTPAAVEAATLRLIGPGATLDREALAAIGIDLNVVRESVEASFGSGALERSPSRRRRLRWRGRRGSCDAGSGHGPLPLTPRAKRCLQLSLHEAISLRHREIGSLHIVLALTAMTDGVAREILSALATPPSLLRTEVLDHYRQAG